MSEQWDESYTGCAYLGTRGYVVRTQSAPNPERWSVFSGEATQGPVFMIGETDNESHARRILESFDGFTCEVFMSKSAGHCTNDGVYVRHTLDDETLVWPLRKRLIVCETHKHVMPEWHRDGINAFCAMHGKLVPDQPIIGERQAPRK